MRSEPHIVRFTHSTGQARLPVKGGIKNSGLSVNPNKLSPRGKTLD